MRWELFSSKYFMVLCHSTDCEVCDAYIRHLLQGVEVGGLRFTPQNLAQALDEAWATGMQDIHEDTQAELHCWLDMAHQGFDEQCNKYDHLWWDYKALEVQLEKEKSHLREAKDTVTHLKGKSIEASTSCPLAPAKRKVTDNCLLLSQTIVRCCLR